MPKYLISINSVIEGRARGSIAKGTFRSLDHLIEVALENQLNAEDDVQIPWGTARSATSPPSVYPPPMTTHGRPKRASLRMAPRVRPSAPVLDPVVDLNLSMPKEEIPVVADPDPKALAGPLLWGQHYKFLPVKVALRVLTRLAPSSPPLGTFSETACSVAVAFGVRLRAMDKAHGRKLGDQVATSFPEGSEKSTHRFRDQYLAYLRPSDRRIDGMLPRLRLVAVYSDGGVNRIGLTSAGREFAGFTNPIIDAGSEGPTMSEEEVNFLLRHIQTKLPEEAKHMAALVRLTSQGVTTPEDLNQKMERFYGGFQENGRPWTPAHLNTMRAGVTSRLFELGLLSKQKQGVAVSYHPTDRGKNWLSQFDRQN